MLKDNNILNHSFWETQSYLRNIDVVIIGSGIVGLNAAISFLEKNKNGKVVILERGIFPTGASTKNAGFACFGSVSELISDIKNSSENQVLETVEMRIKGLEILRKRLGDKNIDFKNYGGYELFDDTEKFKECSDKINSLNKVLFKFTKQKQTYLIESNKIKSFGFKTIKGIINNTKEGQIDTGKMMQHLLKLAIKKGVIILNYVEVNSLVDNDNQVTLNTNIGLIKTKKTIVATNGFANELLKIKDVFPARAQVLITKPISNLKIKGTFHYNEGFVYFRNIGDRILLGGGRNLDFEKETSTEFILNQKIQTYLDTFLKNVILPNQYFEIDQRWTGIMGIGSEKRPIIKSISGNVICAVRMGGMGVAIGSLVGEKAVEKILRG
jgi:glycine/D-amino acid oxidase-like deaminating enzyme